MGKGWGREFCQGMKMCPEPILKVQRQLPIENQEATCLATIRVISNAPTLAPLPQQTPVSLAGPCLWSRQVRASCTLPQSHRHWKSSFSSHSSGLGHFQRALWAPSAGGLRTLPAEIAVDQNGFPEQPGSAGGRRKLAACLLYLGPPLSSAIWEMETGTVAPASQEARYFTERAE